MPWVRSLHVHLHPFGAAVHRTIATSLADLFPNLVWMHVSFFEGRDRTQSAITKEEAFGCFRSTLEQMQELQYLSIGGKIFRSDTMGRSEHVSEGEVAHLVPPAFAGHLQLRSPATLDTMTYTRCCTTDPTLPCESFRYGTWTVAMAELFSRSRSSTYYGRPARMSQNYTIRA